MSATDLHFFLQFKYIPLAANVFVYEHNIHSNRKLEFLALQAFVFVHFFFFFQKERFLRLCEFVINDKKYPGALKGVDVYHWLLHGPLGPVLTVAAGWI